MTTKPFWKQFDDVDKAEVEKVCSEKLEAYFSSLNNGLTVLDA